MICDLRSQKTLDEILLSACAKLIFGGVCDTMQSENGQMKTLKAEKE